jgi:hypothetical protein
MKRLTTLALALILIAAMVPAAFASNTARNWTDAEFEEMLNPDKFETTYELGRERRENYSDWYNAGKGFTQADSAKYDELFAIARAAILRRPIIADLTARNASPWAHDAIIANPRFGQYASIGVLDDYSANISRGEFIGMVMAWVEGELRMYRWHIHDSIFNTPTLRALFGNMILTQYTISLHPEYSKLNPSYHDAGYLGDETTLYVKEYTPLGPIVYPNPIIDESQLNYDLAWRVSGAHIVGITDAQNLNQPLTREQSVTMIMRAVNLVNLLNDGMIIPNNDQRSARVQAPIPAPKADFTDMNLVSSWAIDGVNFARANGIITGVGGGRFDPRSMLTIEQAIVMLDRIKS